MPYGFIVLAVAFALFATSILMPRIERWWLNWLMRRAYNNLKWDIMENASYENEKHYRALIDKFHARHRAPAETVLLKQYLQQQIQWGLGV